MKGVSLQMTRGNMKMKKARHASVRYLIGLTNVVKDDRSPGAKTRDLTYSVGIGIPIP